MISINFRPELQIVSAGVLVILLAALDEDLAGPIAADRIDDVADRDLAFDLGRAAAVGDLLLDRFVERPQDIGVEPVLRIHRPQQRHRRELAALVDADGELSFFVVLISIQLPRSGMMRQLSSRRSPASISETKSTPGCGAAGSPRRARRR